MISEDSDQTQMRFIQALKSGQVVDNCFYRVAKKEVGETAGKKDPFLRLTLADRTGSIKAIMWNNQDCDGNWDTIEEGSIVKVEGKVETYRDNPNLKLSRIQLRGEEDRCDDSWFVESSQYDTDVMWEELLRYAEGFAEPLKVLTISLLEERREDFSQHAAAKFNHHPYLGGLLEHTLNVVNHCSYFSKYYLVYRDLLLAGAILHDIGKLEELGSNPENAYTTRGNLIGHIVLGWGIVQAKAKELGTNEKILTQLGHLILSHQGRPEWSSPQEPKTLEALVLHYADDLDAKMNIFCRGIESDSGSGEFTEKKSPLNRHLFKPIYGGLKNNKAEVGEQPRSPTPKDEAPETTE